MAVVLAVFSHLSIITGSTRSVLQTSIAGLGVLFLPIMILIRSGDTVKVRDLRENSTTGLRCCF